MLAARASNAFVCVRCQLKLLRPSPSSLSRRPSRAHFSSSPFRRGDALDELEQPAPVEQSQPRRKVSAHPLGRLHRQRGQATVRASTVQVEGVKTLGKDAEILVLREVGEAREPSKRAQPDVVQVPDVADAPDILESIQGEGGQSTPQEVDEQLDSLRPKTHDSPDEPHYITIGAYNSLSRTLDKSFTVQQLSHYLAPAKGSGKPPPKGKSVHQANSAPSRGKRSVERTPWFPGVTSTHKRLPGTDAHRDTKKNKSKPLLIEDILRSKWKVVTLEEIESPGEIEIRVNPWQFGLLTSGDSSSALDRVGNLRKAKIQAFETHHLLRITAAKGSAEYAADDIERLLKKTEVNNFRFNKWLDTIPEEDIPEHILKDIRKGNTNARLVDIIPKRGIREVGIITGTSIQEVAGNTVKIRGFDKKSVQEAERRLIDLLPQKTSATYTLVEAQRLDVGEDEMRMLPYVFKDGLPYCNRHQDLGRWTCDSPKLQASGSSSQTLATSHHESIVDALHSSPRPLQPKNISRSTKTAADYRLLQKPQQDNLAIWLRKGGYWQEKSTNRLEAVFGHILYPARVSTTTTPLNNLRSANGLYSYDLPAMTKFLIQEAPAEHHTTSPSILHYHFRPSLSQKSTISNEQHYPTLSLRFRIHPTPHLQEVALKFGEHITDVPLPEQATDLRFKHEQKLCIKHPDENSTVKAFADAVLANIESGGRLTAPESLTIDVPKWTIPGYTTGFDHSATLSVTYSFTHVAHRQSYVSKFGGQPVAYNVLQTGKLGRNGGSLSTYYDKPDLKAQMNLLSSAEERRKAYRDSLHEFVGTTLGIAERITALTAHRGAIKSSLNAMRQSHQEASEGEHKQAELSDTLCLTDDKGEEVSSDADKEPDNSRPEKNADEDAGKPYFLI